MGVGDEALRAVSGWIKVEKDLREDLRVKRIARLLIERGVVTHVRYSSQIAVTLVLGGLNQLWMHADTFARDDDTLEMTVDEIDELTGIEGFSQLLPADWLEVLDAQRVKLPGFQDHNGTRAKKNALTAKRVSKHRSNHSNDAALQPPEKRNAVALPDQTRPDQKRPDQEERERARAGGAEVPRGTVVEAAFSSLLEDWRRDVPEANPEAFAKWIVHVELQGRPMSPAMRLAQARRLAGNGDFGNQSEVVDYCCENGFKALIPIGDVRARTQGMRRAVHTPAPTTAELEAREANRGTG